MNAKYDSICGEACLLGYQNTTLADLLEAIDKMPNYSRWATTRQAILRAIDEGMAPSAPDTWPAECPHGGHRRSSYPEWDELRAQLKVESEGRKKSPPGGGGGGRGGGPISHDTLIGVTSDQHHAQAHNLASHSTKAHNELTDVTSDLHHPQLHEGEHRSGGGDELNHDNLAGFAAAEHKVLPTTIVEALSDHDKAAHDALNIDADTVDSEEAADIVTDARVKAHFPDTIVNVLSDHDKPDHDALGLSHDSLSDVSINDHHAKIHAAEHEIGGGDAIKLDDLATPDDNDNLNAVNSRHGLLRKLSDKYYQCLNGIGQWMTLYDSTSIVICILSKVSANLRNSNDAERISADPAWNKLKETKMGEPTGLMTIIFEMRSTDGSDVFGRIYKNGVAEGAQHSTTSMVYVEFGNNLGPFDTGDLIQVYVKAGTDEVRIQNFRFKYDRTINMLGECTLATPLIIETQNPFAMTHQDP